MPTQTQQKDKTPTPCEVPGCGFIAKGPIGLRTHKSWEHDPRSHAKRMRASKGNRIPRTHARNGLHPVLKQKQKRKPGRRKSTRRVIRVQKRKYTKRQKIATLQPFRVCPVCLSNLQAMQAAATFPIQP